MKKVWECENNFDKKSGILSKLVYGAMLPKADFTLAIPIYGISKTLQETLLNVAQLKKTKLKVQIIISDNKPDEDIDKIIGLLKKSNVENVAFYLSESVLGQLNNFNRCVELANTDYLAMLHDDDLLVPNYYDLVELLLPYMQLHQEIGLIQGARIDFTDKPELKETKRLRIFPVKRDYITCSGYSSAEIPSCGMVFKKKAVLDAGGFNDDFPASGDAFLAVQMLNKGYEYYKSMDVFGYYRVGYNNSITSDICKEFIVEDRKFEESWASIGIIEKIYFRIFGRYFYSNSIKCKIDTFGKFNPELSVEALDYLHLYRTYSKYGIVNLLYRFHWKVLGLLVRARTINII